MAKIFCAMSIFDYKLCEAIFLFQSSHFVGITVKFIVEVAEKKYVDNVCIIYSVNTLIDKIKVSYITIRGL